MERVAESELDHPGHDGRYHRHGRSYTGVVFSVYPGGELQSEGEYQDGLPAGLQRVFRRDGGLQIEGTRSAGQKEGYWRTWHPSGQLASEEWYHFGLALSRKKWDQAGNLIEDFTRAETDQKYQNLLKYRRVWGFGDQPIPTPPASGVAQPPTDPGAARV